MIDEKTTRYTRKDLMEILKIILKSSKVPKFKPVFSLPGVDWATLKIVLVKTQNTSIGHYKLYDHIEVVLYEYIQFLISNFEGQHELADKNDLPDNMVSISFGNPLIENLWDMKNLRPTMVLLFEDSDFVKGALNLNMFCRFVNDYTEHIVNSKNTTRFQYPHERSTQKNLNRLQMVGEIALLALAVYNMKGAIGAALGGGKIVPPDPAVKF